MPFSIKYSLVAMAMLSPALGYADNPLSVYEQALVSDTEIRAAWHELRAKREKYEQSIGALRPSVVLSGKIARNDEDVTFTPGSGTINTGEEGDTSFDSYDLTLTFKQPVYRKAILSNRDITMANSLMAETEFKATKLNLMMRVMQRYINALSTKDKLEFTNAESRSIEEQLLYSQKRLDVGRSTKTDYLEVKAAFDTSVAEVIAARDELDDAMEAIVEITGKYPDDLATLKPDFSPALPIPEDVEHWIKTAEKSNPTIITAQHRLDATTHEVSRSKAGHHPKLDLVARYSNQETGGRFGESQTDDASIALQLEVPLYSGGQVSSRVKESLYKVDSARELLLKNIREVQRETRKVYRNTVTAIRRINALEIAVESSKAALSSIKTGFKVGTRNNADVLDAQRELYKAQYDYSAARYMYILNHLQLKNLAGTLNGEDIKLVNGWFE